MEQVIVYADIILIVSLTVSIPTLWGVCRAYHFKFKILRVILSAITCGTVTILEIVLRMPYIIMILIAPEIFAVMILISFGFIKAKLLLHCTIMLTSENVFLAGLCELIMNVSESNNGFVGYCCIAFGVLLLIVALRLRKSAYRISIEAQKSGIVELYVFVNGNVINVNATLDTGNLLLEPISQCPVIVLKKSITENCFNCKKNSRIVPYRTANGNGLMNCIHADEVNIKINGIWKNAGDVYIGTSEHLQCDALVGAEIINRCI